MPWPQLSVSKLGSSDNGKDMQFFANCSLKWVPTRWFLGDLRKNCQESVVAKEFLC